MLFDPKQVQNAISSKTFTAQHAGIYSDAEITNFWESRSNYKKVR